jgi:predicted Holliday junction resolvase-like endonuclease
MNKTDLIIKSLKASNLYAECSCGGEFKLSESLIFDGTKPFPKEALEIQKKLKQGLKDQEEDLKKKRKLATKKAEITTKSVNIGKNLEKVLPTMKDFKWKLSDCRPMGDPIDLLIFNGYSLDMVRSINFIEVKSGKARLNKHQKAIKDAVEDKRVSYKVFK